MSIFRGGEGKHSLTVAMTGIKLGDRLLHIGCSEKSVLGAIASKVGLSGRACAVVYSESEARQAQKGAANAGVLLEVETAPGDRFSHPDESFDLVVIDNLAGLLSSFTPEARVKCLQEVHRVLAPRGRVIVMERAARGGLGGLFQRAVPDPQYAASGGAVTALKAEGFKAVRLLAERGGLGFVEGGR